MISFFLFLFHSTEFLSLHIRTLGHWTKRLFEVFKLREDENMSDSPDLYDSNQTEIRDDLNKPLEVLAEEGSIHGSIQGSLPGSPSRKEHRSPFRTSGREQSVNGETNSGFENELKGDNEASTVIMQDSPIHGDNNTRGSISTEKLADGHQAVDNRQNDLSGVTNAFEISEADTRGRNGSLVEATGNGETLKAANTRGRQLSPIINPRTSIGNTDLTDRIRAKPSISPCSPVNGRDPALDTSQSIPPQVTKRPQSPPMSGNRPDSSLARRIFSKRLSDRTLRKLSTSSNRRDSRKKVRRNPTLHSLDVSRTLGGTPHTNLEVKLLIAWAILSLAGKFQVNKYIRFFFFILKIQQPALQSWLDLAGIHHLSVWLA